MPEADREFTSASGEEGQLPKPALTDSIAIRQFVVTKPVDLKPRLVQLRDDEKRNQRISYIEVGIGNYLTTLLNASYYGDVAKGFNVGLGVAHRNSANGPVNKSNSGTNRFFVDLKFAAKKGFFELQPYYEWNRYRYYGGFEANDKKSEPDLQQHKSVGALATAFFRVGKNLNYLDAQVNAYKNAFTQSETRFRLQDSLVIKINKRIHALSGGADIATLNYGAYTSGYASNLAYHSDFRWNRIDFRPGLRADFYSIAGKGKAYVFPQIEAAYRLNDSATLFGVVSSGARLNSLHQLSGVNPYLSDSIGIQAAMQKLNIGVGVQAQLGALVSGKVQVGFSVLQGLAGFANNEVDSTRFNVIYYNQNIASFYANLGLRVTPSQELQFGYNLLLRSYGIDNLIAPLGLPRAQHQIITTYNVGGRSKLFFDAQVLITGKRQALSPGEGKIVGLKVFPDLVIGARYRWSDKVALFLRGENLLKQKQPLYYNYQTRGITVLIGASLSI